MKTATKLTIAAIVLAAATGLYAPPSYAFGDAPWCAVINLGMGEIHWDCQYRTVEECRPNVVAGNRGFCNLNPYGPGPNASAPASRARYHKHRHTVAVRH
jgi:hypothetical protein